MSNDIGDVFQQASDAATRHAPSPLAHTSEFKIWKEDARRDDWHTRFVGSDIRQLIGEVERLTERLRAAAPLLTVPTARDLAETIHAARWPADRAMARTPFQDEDQNGREYCLRIARAVKDLLQATRRPLQLGDIVYMNETSPYFADWRGTEMKVVSLRIDPKGKLWASVIEGEPAHRGFGEYDGETTDIDAGHLSTVIANG